jgi:hypothetical protein
VTDDLFIQLVLCRSCFIPVTQRFGERSHWMDRHASSSSSFNLSHLGCCLLPYPAAVAVATYVKGKTGEAHVSVAPRVRAPFNDHCRYCTVSFTADSGPRSLHPHRRSDTGLFPGPRRRYGPHSATDDMTSSFQAQKLFPFHHL